MTAPARESCRISLKDVIIDGAPISKAKTEKAAWREAMRPLSHDQVKRLRADGEGPGAFYFTLKGEA